MPRTNQTSLAVLGVLSVEPMSGYGIRQAISASIGHFWSESFGQIYPVLRELEAEGLVRRHGPAERSRRVVYEITTAGLQRLRELLDEPIAAAPKRNALLLRLFFGRVLGPSACRALVERAKGEAHTALAAYDAIEREVLSEYDGSPDLEYWLLTLRWGRLQSEAVLRWSDEADMTLARLEATASRAAQR